MFSQRTAVKDVEELSSSSLVAKLFPRLTPSSLWPEPEASLGRKRCVIKNHQFWDVTGPALELSENLKLAVSVLFADHSESEIFEGFGASPAILYEVFMVLRVGLSIAAAFPALLIICQREAISRRIGKIIRDSKLLEKYPGFKCLGSTQDPRMPNGGIPQSIAYGSDSSQDEGPGVHVYVARSDSRLRCGTPIYIGQLERNKFRKATLGGFLRISSFDDTSTAAGDIVGMTVAHAFEPNLNFEIDSSIPDEIFDLMDDSDEIYNELDADLLPPTISKEGGQEYMDDDYIMAREDLLQIGYLFKKSATSGNANFDWALIRPMMTFSSFRKNDHMNDPAIDLQRTKFVSEGRHIVTRTASKMSTDGYIMSQSTYLKMPGQKSFGQVLLVQLKGALCHGDSGAWIIDVESRLVLGHIVAGDLQSGVAYVAPAESVFANIESCVRCKVGVLENLHLDSFIDGLNLQQSLIRQTVSSRLPSAQLSAWQNQAYNLPYGSPHGTYSQFQFLPWNSPPDRLQEQSHGHHLPYGSPHGTYSQFQFLLGNEPPDHLQEQSHGHHLPPQLPTGNEQVSERYGSATIESLQTTQTAQSEYTVLDSASPFNVTAPPELPSGIADTQYVVQHIGAHFRDTYQVPVATVSQVSEDLFGTGHQYYYGQVPVSYASEYTQYPRHAPHEVDPQAEDPVDADFSPDHSESHTDLFDAYN